VCFDSISCALTRLFDLSEHSVSFDSALCALTRLLNLWQHSASFSSTSCANHVTDEQTMGDAKKRPNSSGARARSRARTVHAHTHAHAHTRARAPLLHTVRRRVQREGVRRELQACKALCMHACTDAFIACVSMRHIKRRMLLTDPVPPALAQTSMLVRAQQQTARESAGRRTKEKTRMPRVT